MSVSIILGSSAVFLWLCFLLRRYGRLLYFAAKAPGPSLWDFVFVHAKELLSSNLVHHAQKLSMAYNNRPWGMWTMRGFVVVLSDCDSVEAVFKSKNFDNKPTVMYDQMSCYMGRGLITLNGEEHKLHRKPLGPVYRKSVLSTYLHQFCVLANELTENLRQVANGEDVDTQLIINQHVRNMSVYAFGKDDVPVQPLVEILDIVQVCMKEAMHEAMNPVTYYLWHRLKRSTRETERKIRAALDKRDCLYLEKKPWYISQYSGDTNEKKSLTCPLDVLAVEFLIKRDDEAALIAEGTTLLSAALEATSFVTNMCLAAIALHPEVQKRIFEEIDAIFGGSQRPVQHEDLAQLNYLEMAIKETLRLFPPVPIFARKAEKEVVLGGVIVPKDTIVLVNILALHRNPDFYKDPLKYDPSRFSAESSEGRNPYTYIPFSLGPRNCIGQDLAWMMLKTSLCYIFREFQVLPGTDIKSIADIEPPMHITFHVPKFSLRYVKR